MDSFGAAALTSWNLDPLSIALFPLIAAVYIRGWLLVRRAVRRESDKEVLAAFLLGLTLIFVATQSPLDTFDRFFLAAHMGQHLLLMMFAPPLILLGHPTVPLLRGLPKRFVKEGLGPFLIWPALRRIFQRLTSPPVAWSLFAASTVFWHLPWLYEAALQSPWIHGLEHASFFWTGILFWWPIVRPMPGRSRWPEWVLIPYLLASDVVNTGISILFVFSGRLLYPSYHSLDDQILAGLIMWVPGSVVYLIPAFIITMRVLTSPKLRGQREKITRLPRTAQRTKHFRLVRFRRPAQVVMLLAAIVVAGDGFFGTQGAPMNLAGFLPWIHWRFFSLLALLAVGNLFCMACPFTLVRDIGRKILPARLRWPGALRSKWLAAVLILTYLWAYEAFALWSSPWLTAWIVIGYFSAALLIDGIFRGASFCKYVCPIGQFQFVSSLISPREVRVKSQQTCQSCRTYDCIRGNERARGCELYLFQPKKEGNLDCTFCLDCVKACPSDNVALLPVLAASTILKDSHRSSIGRLSRRTDLAALALLIVFGAFVNAAGMTGTVMMWEHHLHARLWPGAMPWIIAAFTLAGAVLLPLLITTVVGFVTSTELAHRFAFALVPVGFAMWLAHLLFHIAGPSLSMQVLVLDGGLLLTLWGLWRIKPGGRFFLTTSIVACALYAVGIWILAQPMQMRGMM